MAAVVLDASFAYQAVDKLMKRGIHSPAVLSVHTAAQEALHLGCKTVAVDVAELPEIKQAYLDFAK